MIEAKLRATMAEMFNRHVCSQPTVIVLVLENDDKDEQKPLTAKEFRTTMSKTSEALDRIESKIAALTTSEAAEDQFAGEQAAKITALEAEIERLKALPTLSDEESARLDALETKLDEIKAGAEAAPEPTPEG